MLLKEWVKENKTCFSQSDLQFLLKEVFSRNKQNLFGEDIILDSRNASFLNKIKSSYLKGMPIGYLLKKEEFFGLEFMVNPSVLIPRPDTEVITEKAIRIIKNNNLINTLDLCCGAANIAISISKSFDGKVKVTASDVNLKALKVARSNVKRHKVKVRIVKSDLFNTLRKSKFDIIISNPPYLKNSEIKGSLKYEPRQALAAGKDGLCFLKKILKSAHKHLNENGFLVIEAGYNQKSPLNAILEKTGKYEIIEWIKDYGGNFRGVILKKG